MKDFEILRGRRWEGGAHASELEERLMKEYGKQGLVVLRRGRAFLLAAALLVFGGLAGAGGTAWLSRLTVEETPLPDGRTHVRVRDGDRKVFDGILEKDEGLFQLEDGDIVQVEPADPQAKKKVDEK